MTTATPSLVTTGAASVITTEGATTEVPTSEATSPKIAQPKLTTGESLHQYLFALKECFSQTEDIIFN